MEGENEALMMDEEPMEMMSEKEALLNFGIQTEQHPCTCGILCFLPAFHLLFCVL